MIFNSDVTKQKKLTLSNVNSKLNSQYSVTKKSSPRFFNDLTIKNYEKLPIVIVSFATLMAGMKSNILLHRWSFVCFDY